MVEETVTERGRRSSWRCPLCGNTQSYLDVENAYEKAKMALLGHVRAVDDPRHGPAQEYPDGFDREAVDSYIEVE